MPFMSDQAIKKVSHTIQKMKAAHVNIRDKVQKKTGEAIHAAEVVGGGALAGYLHTRFADEKTGKLLIPGTQIEALLGVGFGMVAVGYLDMAGRYDDDAMNVGAGMLAGYAFQKMSEVGNKAKANGTIFGQLQGAGQAFGMMANPAVGAMTDSEYAMSLRRNGL